MRVWMMAAAMLMLAACAKTYSMDTPLGHSAPPAWPFPVARGSAIAPPGETASRQAAPPEGRAAGGVDFGAWRSADTAVYGPAFQQQMRARLAGKGRSAAEADLGANGFACEAGERMECRIEIAERGCAYDWYVVREAESDPPIADFEKMCPQAQ
jgi:hypothetical protein